MTAGDLESPLLGRLVRPADYVRVLATPMRLRSPHFAVHHLEGRPLPLKRPMARTSLVEAAQSVATADVDDARERASVHADESREPAPARADAMGNAVDSPVTASLSTELSTGVGDSVPPCVDDSQVPVPLRAGEYPDAPVASPFGPQRWLGLVVPKRHAKRAVTRTLVKRQIRTIAADCAPRLEPGLWVVRQRSPFDPKQYPSAASDALKVAARDELRALFERAARGERDKLKPRGPHDAAAPRGRGGKPAKAAKPAKATAGGTPPPATPEGAPCAA
jgi:ribonuclease P protein component